MKKKISDDVKYYNKEEKKNVLKEKCLRKFQCWDKFGEQQNSVKKTNL